MMGEKREWEQFLTENLKFPFEAQVDECSAKEFFTGEASGPINYLDN